MEQHLGLIISVISLASTVVVIISFFNRLKWTQEVHEKRFEDLKKDIDSLGTKVSTLTAVQQEDVKTILCKVDAIDKAVISMTVTMSFIKDTVSELKDGNKNGC